MMGLQRFQLRDVCDRWEHIRQHSCSHVVVQPRRIVIVTHSNFALDEIIIRLCKRKGMASNIVRLGSQTTNDIAKRYCVL